MAHALPAAPAAADDGSAATLLTRIIEHAAHLLPAQGPISIFIHHNPLHALEDWPFEQAVEHAADRLGREPYLAEARYRDKLVAGRIRVEDVEAVLDEHLGAQADEDVGGTGSRRALWRAVLLWGIPAVSDAELPWLLEETPALARWRPDLPPEARSALAGAVGEGGDRREEERLAVRRLWRACREAIARAGAVDVPPGVAVVRHRDLLVAVGGPDVDAWIHPPLIRFLAGYLDQGLAHWPMPGREAGIHGCFLALYRTRMAAGWGRWARALPGLVADDTAGGRTALQSVLHSLRVLGVPDAGWEDFLAAELLALRGWAGMVRQIEERPDRVPVHDLRVTLRGYLAVRLLWLRAALAEAARDVGFDGPLAGLRAWLRARLAPPPAPTLLERAWRLFHLVQLRGCDATMVEQWTPAQVRAIEAELRVLDERRRRHLLHLAFERAVRGRFLDALVQHAAVATPATPAFQAIFCIDEREESFRRHLEETDPACETFGTPGFFGVAMYHQAVTDAHPRPLCPVVIRPEHYVAEAAPDEPGLSVLSRRLQRRAAGYLGYNVHLGSRLPVRGALLMTVFGWLALVPLVLRVVFPWLSSRLARVQASSIVPGRTHLQLARRDTPPPIGKYFGFTVDEMAAIVRRLLEDTGLADRLAPLVLVIGHGSVSLNNPHESAHDCGACGGGRGGPNARAFAQMANDPRVRARLEAEGLRIPDTTWFVGAQRNTCDNSVTVFDADLVPPTHAAAFDRARAALETARRREAHERCRRFDAVPTWYPPAAALAHVEARAADLAQPRPEYGHATNALCIVGRRARTRGLFLDRRAFLASYDGTRDPDGAVLERVLAAVIPVCAGINLEYYFSYVDPTGYGCGTKLPHNVTALLGVMDGAQSDLRTGLPWQMVEIHEPVRLTVVVEAPRDRVLRIVERHPVIGRLVRNRWIWLACLDPDAPTLWALEGEAFVAHAPVHALPVVRGDSAAWYAGKRGFLSPATLRPDGTGEVARPAPAVEAHA